MTISIRPARISDSEPLADMLVEDAKSRNAVDPVLWRLNADPRGAIIAALARALDVDASPVRHAWLIAEVDGHLVGCTHSIILPVPPIYAAPFGPPGLIMEDCCVSSAAPRQTRAALIEAAEADLVQAGAKILLASAVTDGTWTSHYMRDGYEPLTCYFAKSGLTQSGDAQTVRKAEVRDVPDIVTSSAVNRQILNDLKPDFWKPHPDADTRFAQWMQRSLTLADRDMFVSEDAGVFLGYAISQPATPLHFPPAHDISEIGVIDDFHHVEMGDPTSLARDATRASAVFRAAESARVVRGNTALLVVCPAAWTAKAQVLTRAGYTNAMTWFFKKVG